MSYFPPTASLFSNDLFAISASTECLLIMTEVLMLLQCDFLSRSSHVGAVAPGIPGIWDL